MISKYVLDGCSTILPQKLPIFAQSQILPHSAAIGAQATDSTSCCDREAQKTNRVNMWIMKNYKTSFRAFELFRRVLQYYNTINPIYEMKTKKELPKRMRATKRQFPFGVLSQNFIKKYNISKIELI